MRSARRYNHLFVEFIIEAPTIIDNDYANGEKLISNLGIIEKINMPILLTTGISPRFKILPHVSLQLLIYLFADDLHRVRVASTEKKLSVNVTEHEDNIYARLVSLHEYKN